MSYLKQNLVLEKSYVINRKCSGCGHEMSFINTKCFRVNANGNSVDVWLIYQCKKCKHTYNLPIYERIKPNKIPSELYEKFLENDEELAIWYGTNMEILKRSHSRIIQKGTR